VVPGVLAISATLILLDNAWTGNPDLCQRLILLKRRPLTVRDNAWSEDVSGPSTVARQLARREHHSADNWDNAQRPPSTSDFGAIVAAR
jgi:hypothetical protein